jgi:hypothetical protein
MLRRSSGDMNPVGPIPTVASSSQALFTFPRVAIEGLHYAKTGVIEQE